MCYAKKMDLEVQRVCTGFLEIRFFLRNQGERSFESKVLLLRHVLSSGEKLHLIRYLKNPQ